MRGEPLPVDVEADVAVVDRRHVMGGIDHVCAVDRGERFRLVRLEQILVEGAREQVVVDPEEDVALRVALREQRPVDRLAGVATLQDPERQAALALERGLHRLRHHERVVRDEHDFLALARISRSSAARGGHRGEERERDPELVPKCHKISSRSGAGITATRQPCSTVIRASSAAKVFEVPRLEPAGSVSPLSGYSRPSVETPTCGPVNGKQRDELTGRAGHRSSTADDV